LVSFFNPFFYSRRYDFFDPVRPPYTYPFVVSISIWRPAILHFPDSSATPPLVVIRHVLFSFLVHKKMPLDLALKNAVPAVVKMLD
jgi:hypothetical protein